MSALQTVCGIWRPGESPEDDIMVALFSHFSTS